MPLVSDSQIAAFLSRLPAHQIADGDDDQSPKVIFRGALELDVYQEQALVDACLKWKDDLNESTGRSALQAGAKGGAGINAVTAWENHRELSFMEQARLWELVYNQDFTWRKKIRGLFADGDNRHLPLTRRTVQQMIARATNHYFATKPFFSAIPVGAEDPATASDANDWAQYKFDQAKVDLTLQRVIEKTLKTGGAVTKCQHALETDRFETFAEVMIGPDGNPLVALDGDFIFKGDQFVPQMPAAPLPGAPPDPSQPAPADPAAAPVDPTQAIAPVAPITATPPPLVLQRDMQTPLPENAQYAVKKVVRRTILYKGPKAKMLRTEDFMASEGEDLQKCECTVEFYDQPAIDIVDTYLDRLKTSGQFDAKELPRVMAMLRGAQSNPSTSSAIPGPSAPTNQEPAKRGDPLVRCAEFCILFDANNDGKRENVNVVIDLDTERPILYDYVANVYTLNGGIRPYVGSAVNPEEGQSTGTSCCEVFWAMQQAVDTEVCRQSFANSKEGTAWFFNAELTTEGIANPNLEINGKTIYHKRDVNIPASKILEGIPLTNIKAEHTDKMIEMYQQMFLNMSGVQNANDANAAGLNSSELATGINNIAQSGEELFGPILTQLEPGIEAICKMMLMIAVKDMDPVEVFHVMGPDGAAKLMQLATENLQTLPWDLGLEVTSNKGQQVIAENTAAKDTALEYDSLQPASQAKLQPLYQQNIKAYKIRDADKLVPMPSPEAVLASQQGRYLPPPMPNASQPQGQGGGPGPSMAQKAQGNAHQNA